MQFTCSIKQIKGHLKEYVSPSKASNNCLIQFSPATYKQGQIGSTNMFKYLQLPKTWLASPPTNKFILTKNVGMGGCPLKTSLHMSLSCIFPLFLSSTEHPHPNKLSLRYCKHFQGEICIKYYINSCRHQSILYKPQWIRDFCSSLPCWTEIFWNNIWGI